MTKGTRRGLFYGLIALFLVVGTALVLYSQGWRLDLRTGLISKIGAIYVRSYPQGADILLDGKPMQNKSGFLSAGTLLSDLFPKTHTVQLTETGYETWHENVAVLPSLVTTLKYAVLVPQNAVSAASGTAEHFFAAQGTVIKENPAGTVSVNGNVVGYGTLAGATADGRAFMFKDANGEYQLYGARNSTTTNLSATLAKDGVAVSMIDNIILDPHDSSQIIVMGQKKIWMLDLGSHALTLVEKTPAAETLSPSVSMSDSLIAWTRFAVASGTHLGSEPAASSTFEIGSGTSEIILYDRNAGALRETSTTVAGATEKIAWIRGGTFGVLQNDGSLYLYESGNDTARKLADDVKDFFASDDGTMVGALEHASLEIFSLDDPAGYYRFNLPDVAQIQNLIWYKDETHLFVNYPDHISFLDIQDLGLQNFTTAIEGTSASYDPSSNSLYFISPSNQLIRLGFPS